MYPLRRYTKISPWYPILVLESTFPRWFRRLVINITTGFGALGGIVFSIKILLQIPTVATIVDPSLRASLDIFLSDRFLGVLCLLLAVATFFISLEAFYRSYYFDDVAGVPTVSGTLVSFEVAWILHRSRFADPLMAFLTSIYGDKVMRRLGISKETVKTFLDKRQASENIVTIPELPIDKTDEITLPEFAELLAKGNPDFADWLASCEVTVPELVGASDWVVWKQEIVDRRERWWSKDSLERIPSIGSTWGYGETTILDQYSRDLLNDPAMHVERFTIGSRGREVYQIETILARNAEANAILVAEPGSVKMDIMYELASRIRQGNVVPELKHTRPVVFQTGVFLAGFKDKSTLESSMIALMNEVVRAGNILLIIDDLPNLVLGFQSLQSNLLSILDPYLASILVQAIALADTDAFYRIISPQAGLLNRFEKVQAEDMTVPEIIRTLEGKVLDFEHQTSIRMTFPALVAIVDLADAYLPDGSLQDKALDLLIEIMSVYKTRVSSDITKKDIYSYIRTKTNVPVGEVEAGEKDRLLNLEAFLGERVIGQTEAIAVVAGAMRRARTGVRNPKRPIGSFLFLGPTGVGKTETAKALAQCFFGSDEAMNRLDMSEYQGSDALGRLIGSFETNKPGVFATMMRERPYGVLLLDEFEKASPEIHNLFLQVLDEGFFSDMLGKRINIRNTIVIATSNAGSDFIWSATEQGKNLADIKDQLIDTIVKSGIYKPELLNRFDAVVTFHPLLPDELLKIASLMLKKLASRLLDQGIELEITDTLTQFVATQGANKIFGARPMQRFIQDNVEQTIAKKIIEGTIAKGVKVKLAPSSSGSLEVLPA